MTIVERWTGHEARLLRHALRLSVRGFASYLGISVRTVSRWEQYGRDRVPCPEFQAMLDTALERAAGDARERFTASRHPGHQRGQAGRAPGSAPIGEPISYDEEALMLNLADESTRHASRAGHSNIANEQLDQFDFDLARVSVDMLASALIPMVRELRHIRDEAFTALEGRQHPGQTRRLYAIAARSCGLLGGAAADRFGLHDAATKHVRTASLAAAFAEAPALIAWSASLRSTVAFWQGRYRSAAAIARQARRHAPPGVEPARLGCLEARAWARLGDRDAMELALSAARRAGDQEGPAAGDGFMAFPRANQARVTATAWLWIGEHDRARTELTEAIDLLSAEYDSPAHLAAARVDLAEAHLAAGALDAAASALGPLLAGSDTHLAGAARRTASLIRRLRAPRYTGSADAGRLVEDIEAFLASREIDGVAVPAGPTSDRPLPG